MTPLLLPRLITRQWRNVVSKQRGAPQSRHGGHPVELFALYQRRLVMSSSCSRCGKLIKSGPFAKYDDLESTMYNGVCRGCSVQVIKEGQNPTSGDPIPNLQPQSAPNIVARASNPDEIPAISTALYVLCGLAVFGGLILYSATDSPFWLALMIVEVTFTLAFAAIINYLYSAKNSLKAIQQTLSNEPKQSN